MGAIFDDELKRLRGRFMEMGIDASEQIYQATKAFNEKDAQLALAPYYYFTSSIYKGECTCSRVGLMTAKSSDTPLYLAKINGKEIYELAEKYLADSDEKFHITNKYKLLLFKFVA